METVRYVINQANQIACVDDASADGHCDDGETLWVYDAFGNLKSDGTNTYTYDAANRLSSITTASGTTTYIYNGDSDRIAQNVNGSLTTYVLDTATPLTMVLAERTADHTTHYWHGLDTMAQSDGTTVEYFGYDGLGSVRQLVGESGALQLTQTFDPYGNGFSKAGSAQSSFGYSGEQVDANGFVFLRARYYNPSTGSFFQLDPSRLETNLDQYVGSNPVKFVDPSGLQQVPCEEDDWLCKLSQQTCKEGDWLCRWWAGGVVYPPVGDTVKVPIGTDGSWLKPGELPKITTNSPNEITFDPAKFPSAAPAIIPCWLGPLVFTIVGIPLLLCGDTPLGCGTGPKPGDKPIEDPAPHKECRPGIDPECTDDDDDEDKIIFRGSNRKNPSAADMRLIRPNDHATYSMSFSLVPEPQYAHNVAFYTKALEVAGFQWENDYGKHVRVWVNEPAWTDWYQHEQARATNRDPASVAHHLLTYTLWELRLNYRSSEE